MNTIKGFHLLNPDLQKFQGILISSTLSISLSLNFFFSLSLCLSIWLPKEKNEMRIQRLQFASKFVLRFFEPFLTFSLTQWKKLLVESGSLIRSTIYFLSSFSLFFHSFLFSLLSPTFFFFFSLSNQYKYY